GLGSAGGPRITPDLRRTQDKGRIKPGPAATRTSEDSRSPERPDFLQPKGKRHNAVRMIRKRQTEEQPPMQRLELSRSVIQHELGYSPGDLNCLFKLPGPREIFEISFKTPEHLTTFWHKTREDRHSNILNRFHIEPITEPDRKTVTIIFYNETVTEYDIRTWLARHAQVDSDVRQIRDEDGIWTGARKCNITLRRDPAGTIKHLPSTIMLGNNRGQVFYYGMPKLCRNCGATGHLAANCTVIRCKNCGDEHFTKDCTEQRKCNLCGNEGHVFRNCPTSYRGALAARTGTAGPDSPTSPHISLHLGKPS
uniref:CCHC-type domain-containing protein n=1 Tax=Esox lucius TaxID=8010 RepID=A0A3P9AAI3_ESOLU